MARRWARDQPLAANGELILRILGEQGVPLSQEAKAKILSTRDEGALRRWLIRAGSVDAEEELFASSSEA
jgi:hypothetical protein